MRELSHLTYMLRAKESFPKSFIKTSCLSSHKDFAKMSMVEMVNISMLHFSQSQHMEVKKIEATEKAQFPNI